MALSRIFTYAIGLALGVGAFIFPSFSHYLIPAAAAAIGYAKQHQADAKTIASLTSQISSTLVALESAQKAQTGKTKQ